MKEDVRAELVDAEHTAEGPQGTPLCLHGVLHPHSQPPRQVDYYFLFTICVCVLVCVHTRFMQAPTQKSRSGDPPDAITGN